MMGCVLYFVFGVILAMVLGLIKDFGDFCRLVTVIIGWPFYVVIILIVSVVCGLAKAIDSLGGGVK